MTDNEIIKALECCIKDDYDKGCMECPVHCYKGCDFHLAKFALDLINRQKAEIERLSVELDLAKAFYKEKESEFSLLNYRHNKTLNQLNDYQSIAKTEAVKEFAERFLKKVHDNHYLLVDQINSKDYGMFTIGIEQAVNEMKKEMAGE